MTGGKPDGGAPIFLGDLNLDDRCAAGDGAGVRLLWLEAETLSLATAESLYDLIGAVANDLPRWRDEFVALKAAASWTRHRLNELQEDPRSDALQIARLQCVFTLLCHLEIVAGQLVQRLRPAWAMLRILGAVPSTSTTQARTTT